jgi:hypothetical protein
MKRRGRLDDALLLLLLLLLGGCVIAVAAEVRAAGVLQDCCYLFCKRMLI